MRKCFMLLFLAAFTFAQAQEKVQNFKGTIINNKVDSLVIKSLLGKFRLALPIDKQGHFSGTIKQGANLFNLIYDGVELGIYLSNDTNLTLSANGADFKNTLLFEGEGAVENKILRQMDSDTDAFEIAAADKPDEVALKAKANALSESWAKAIKSAKLSYINQGPIRMMERMSKDRLQTEVQRIEDAKKFKGKPSPQFSYADVNGKTVKLSDFKGKYVYIDVWATWCGPCRQEIPHLQKLEENFKGKNIAFISLSIDKPEDIEKWKKMVSEKHMGGIQVLADNAWDSTFAKAYEIKSIPRFILIDPKGNIVDPDAHRPSQPELKDQLAKLLN